ncbi:MAG: hypothetical protein ABW167_09545 [Baekduia sp.]
MSNRLNHDARKRDDMARDGGADDEVRKPPSHWGSSGASKKQQDEMMRLHAETGIPLPKGLLTRNVARSWLAKARVAATLAKRDSGD